MKTAVRYFLAIFALFLVVCWMFNHVSAWGSIIFAILVVAVWLVSKSDDIKSWFNNNF